MNDIYFTEQGHLGVITLNRPKALHALTLEMIDALYQQLLLWQDDVDIHAVVIHSTGEKAFCVGGDVRWLYESDARKQLDFFRREYKLNDLIHHYRKPYIALMQGLTMGGGVGISLHGTHPIANEAFVFAMPETTIGFFPDIGASYLLSRCKDAFGMYLGLTGDRINAQQAQALGLVRAVVPAESFDGLLERLIDLDLSNAADQRLHAFWNDYQLPMLENPLIPIRQQIEQSFTQQQVESILKTLSNNNDSWSQKTKETLLQKSPLSLKVTLELLKRAKTLDIGRCLEMDFMVVQHFMQGHDFYEGVRALLIDKDKQPQWKPEALNDVTTEMVMSYFNPVQPLGLCMR